jgi:hypothetical protein
MMAAFEQPLPDTFAEFSTLLAGLFPVLMDTKFLALFKQEAVTGRIVHQDTRPYRSTVRCAFFGRDLHSRSAVAFFTPLLRLKLLHACD